MVLFNQLMTFKKACNGMFNVCLFILSHFPKIAFRFSCGMNSSADWLNHKNGTLNIEKDQNVYPESCCPENIEGTCTDEHVYTQGCRDKLKDLFRSGVTWVAVAAIAAVFIQLVAIVGSCCIARAIRKDYQIV